jgi:hypothetical protein
MNSSRVLLTTYFSTQDLTSFHQANVLRLLPRREREDDNNNEEIPPAV